MVVLCWKCCVPACTGRQGSKPHLNGENKSNCLLGVVNDVTKMLTECLRVTKVIIPK